MAALLLIFLSIYWKMCLIESQYTASYFQISHRKKYRKLVFLKFRVR